MNVQNEALLKFTEESTFTGYTDYQTETEVIALIKGDKLVDELTDEGYVILKETPFYAEMGGQVSDSGYIYNDSLKAEVIEMITSPNKQHVHIVNIEEVEHRNLLSLRPTDSINLALLLNNITLITNRRNHRIEATAGGGLQFGAQSHRPVQFFAVTGTACQQQHKQHHSYQAFH